MDFNAAKERMKKRELDSQKEIQWQKGQKNETCQKHEQLLKLRKDNVELGLEHEELKYKLGYQDQLHAMDNVISQYHGKLMHIKGNIQHVVSPSEFQTLGEDTTKITKSLDGSLNRPIPEGARAAKAATPWDSQRGVGNTPTAKMQRMIDADKTELRAINTEEGFSVSSSVNDKNSADGSESITSSEDRIPDVSPDGDEDIDTVLESLPPPTFDASGVAEVKKQGSESESNAIASMHSTVADYSDELQTLQEGNQMQLLPETNANDDVSHQFNVQYSKKLDEAVLDHRKPSSAEQLKLDAAASQMASVQEALDKIPEGG